MANLDDKQVQFVMRRYIQFTGLTIDGFAAYYKIKPRTMENWISVKVHRKPTEFNVYALGRLIKYDFGFKDEYLDLDEEQWIELLEKLHGNEYISRVFGVRYRVDSNEVKKYKLNE